MTVKKLQGTCWRLAPYMASCLLVPVCILELFVKQYTIYFLQNTAAMAVGILLCSVVDPDRVGSTSFLPDPGDPDRYQCQEYEKVDKLYFLSQKIHMLSKILEIMISLTLMRQINHCKLSKLSLKVKKNRIFQHV